MDNVSQPSTCLRNCETVEEDLKDESLAVGHRKRLSASLSFSADDLRSLVVQDKELDKNPSLRAGISKDESENEMVSSKASTSDSDAQLNPKAAAQRWGFFDVLKKGSMLGITTFGANISSLRIVNMKKPTKPTGLHTFHPGIPAMKSMAGKTGRNSRHSLPMMDPSLENGLNCFKSSWKNFSLLELQTATNNFTPDNLIGEGGYAEVYKGLLQDGQLVAIKQLTRGSQEDMTADFLSELGILVHVNHRNIANVIGYGIEGGMHLVLHLSPHGSLASLLTGAKEKLDWSTRFKIALGAAEGLSYLHEGCQRRIIHRDIKAANILLTEDFEPQICDFGLAKWLPDQWSHLTVSTFEGTFGYLPPEVFINGVVDEKTDVYAYGVLLLELISGRLALDKTQKSLLVWAKPLLLKNDVYELVDPSLDHAYNKEEMNRMVLTATLCIHDSPEERPQMSKVVRMLTGNDIESLQRAKKLKARPSLKRTVSMGVYSGEECISAMYMNDNQHLRIALGL